MRRSRVVSRPRIGRITVIARGSLPQLLPLGHSHHREAVHQRSQRPWTELGLPLRTRAVQARPISQVPCPATVAAAASGHGRSSLRSDVDAAGVGGHATIALVE